MNSAHPFGKKPALCRYFAASGNCMYGNDCQFLHESANDSSNLTRPSGAVDSPLIGEKAHVRGRVNKFLGPPPPHFENSDGGNGDQFFSATFGPPNGPGKFPTYGSDSESSRSSGLTDLNGPKNTRYPHHDVAVSSADDSRISNQMAALVLGESDMVMGPKKPPNSSLIGMSHSTSTPSFVSYAQTSTPEGPLISGHPASVALHPVIANASPMTSPHLSPQGSPLVSRRRSPTDHSHIHTPTSDNSSLNRTMQENVGGTTYFFTQDDMSLQQQSMVLPNFTVFTSVLPHVAHMKTKGHQQHSFFMPDELKMELLSRHAATLLQVDTDQAPDIPQQVDNYHNLFPLEIANTHMRKSSTFGYQTTVYKAVNTKDGLTYCLRCIHGYRWVNTKTFDLLKCVEMWRKMQHPNIVHLREVFTTKAFGDHSLVFVYDFYPSAETLMTQHFSSPARLNGPNQKHPYEGTHRPYSADKKGSLGGGRQHSGLLPENLLWTYIIQLTSSLRTIHAHGLACRVLDPTKILLTDKSRLRLNCIGIFDVLSFDASQPNPMSVIPHYQQEDLTSLGKVILALACNSIIAIQRDRLQTSMEIVSRNYTGDLKHLLVYLLNGQNRGRCINDVMPMIGARFYTQLDQAYLNNDVQQQALAKEVENGRLFRLLCKFGAINERPHINMDTTWSENGDRYMLKLFRDYVFHQVDENSSPWVDMAHIVQCINKLDAGAPEKICLMSPDEQSVLIVTYAELKKCLDTAFNELTATTQNSGKL